MTSVSIRSIVAVAVSAIVALYANAEEVSADSAGVAAQRWLEDGAALGCNLGVAVDSVRTCSPQADASFHVVKLKGGGFVVMSSDTTREPVVAFSSGGNLVESDANPMWVLLKKDLALRVGEEAATNRKSGLLKATGGSSSASGNEAKWNRLLGKSRGLLRTSQGVSSVSDIRVAPLVQSKWSQDSVGGSICYNYYTPSHYVCGCVATAGAQIMRYFEWPRSDVSVAPFTNPYCEVNGSAQTLTTQGGSYNWNQMPLVPDGYITEQERQAIGKLTSDIGICVGMSYASNGSGVGGYMLAEAFTNHYGYANALSFEWDGDISGSDDMKNVLLSNFDAGLPVAISLSGDGDHEIVGDGYGYSDDTLYLHFNMGWSGTDDAWYAPPNMVGSQYNFSVMEGCVCNIFTNSAYANGVICSGRVLDATGAPIANADVSAKKSGTVVKRATTNAKGIYALVLSAGSYVLSASSGNSSATASVTLNANVGKEIIASGMYADVYYGQYWDNEITIGNRCGQDITITGVAGVAEPQFNPASCLFYPSTNVEITCATSGATIRYTTDGSDPTELSTIYDAPILVKGDTEIRARAWKSGMNSSAVVSETYTYDAAQGAPKGDYFANPIVISGESGSRVIDDNAVYTVESNEPLHTLENYSYYDQYHTVWYKWTAPGSGTMSFVTKCSSRSGNTISRRQTAVAAYTGNDLSSLTRLAYATQPDSANEFATTLNVSVEEGVAYYIVGMTTGESATGAFTLTWSGDLTVSQTATSTTPVQVPYAWLDGIYPGQGSSAAAYETLAFSDSDGDGLATWAEYLLGTDPTNASSRLEATIRMDGSSPIVESNADTNRLAAFGYLPIVKGKQSLDTSEEWATTNLLHRFFKIFVEKNQ